MKGDLHKVDFQPKVNESLVSGLRSVLDDAEAGTMETGCFVGYMKNGDVVTVLATSPDLYRDMAALHRLLHVMQLTLDRSARDC